VETTDYLRGLDKCPDGSKIPEISGKISVPFRLSTELPLRIYEANRRRQPPQQRRIMNQCKHPRVQVVSRDEDTEYVECLECREVFESSEFKDMAIEERIPSEEV
jgi:hypothetical protein